MKQKDFKVLKEGELLEFLLTSNTGESRNNLKDFLKRKQILVNGKPITQFNYLVKENDIVSISPVSLNDQGKVDSKLEITYEDDDFLAVNKPSGLLAVEDLKEKNKTAFNYMNEYYNKSNPGKRLFILHRIDKETSGVLVFAKSEKIKNLMQDSWNKLVTIREYTAIVDGIIPKKKGTIISNLTEGTNGLVYSTKDISHSQKAITNYEVIKETQKYSMLKVLLETGRKNQIRVHMKEMNHPIIGDDKYGRPTNPLGRLGLHNKVLEFVHPITKKKIFIKANEPKEFNSLFVRK